MLAEKYPWASPEAVSNLTPSQAIKFLAGRKARGRRDQRFPGKRVMQVKSLAEYHEMFGR